MVEPPPRRKDARRNRELLVEVARAAFAEADVAVPLEGIAREAGVGIGTLYRHFPTREALVEAVYAAELDDVTTSAPLLLEELAPDRALREWLDRYAHFATRKRGLMGTMRAGWTSGRLTTPVTRERITAAIGALLAAGAEAGSLRDDVEPDDVTTMLLGVFLSTAPRTAEEVGTDRPAGTPDEVARLLDLIVDAVRRHEA